MLIRHTFIFIVRKWQQDKWQIIMNVIGLTIGISSFLFILLIVRFEQSFDRFQLDYNRIYRIYSKFEGVLSGVNRGAPTAIYPKIKEEFIGVESLTNFQTFSCTVSIPIKNTESKDFGIHDKIIFARPDYFSVFDHYEWIIGNPEVSLSKPFQVVLTESRAMTYFGKTEAIEFIGREIQYSDSLHVIVSGIVRDVSKKTDFDFTEFISLNTIEKSWLRDAFQLDSWNSVNSSSQLFIKLAPNTLSSKIQEQLPVLGRIFSKKHKNGWNNSPQLQPLANLHFDSTLGIFDHSRSSPTKSTLLLLIGIATLILFIALINNVNLTTSQNLRRAKEVGIRRVLGSTNINIIVQFIYESLILSVLSIIFSIGLVWLFVQNFTVLVPLGLKFSIMDPFIFIILCTITSIISLLSGLFPALVLSSYNPAIALTNRVNISQGSTWYNTRIRMWLTAFQISCGQVLLFFSTVVIMQIHFMLNKDIGFTSESIINFYFPRTASMESTLILKNELNKIPEIEFTSIGPPPNSGHPSSTSEFNDGAHIVHHMVSRIVADTSYLKLYNIKLLAGRNFQYETAGECLINEAYLNELGFVSPFDIIGKTIDRTHKIVGIIKDFHTQDLHSSVMPLVISSGTGNCLGAKVRGTHEGGSDINSVVQKSKDAWQRIYSDEFKYSFLDEIIKNSYKDEIRIQYITNIATVVAVLISLLGLYGFSSLSIIRRKKEIGIRKVLGSTTIDILNLLLRDSLKIVLFAFVVAMPIAYYIGEEWLERFAYRISLDIWIYFSSGIISLTIAIITIIIAITDAAKANPVKLLRTE